VPIVLISESLLRRSTVNDGRLLRDRVLCVLYLCQQRSAMACRKLTAIDLNSADTSSNDRRQAILNKASYPRFR
jgi:hypothetical protein